MLGDNINDTAVLGDAIQVFKLVQRCLHYINPLLAHLDSIGTADDPGLYPIIKSIVDESAWPSGEEDLNTAALAIVRIQYAYQLDVSLALPDISKFSLNFIMLADSRVGFWQDRTWSVHRCSLDP